MNKKVAILMSTYNGEKYIANQIESILSQNYSNFHLYIRDDCSTDNTVKEIKKFKDSRITLIEGKDNLGYPAGFYHLCSQDINADYFSFSDQDDVWHADKINNAVKMLEGSDEKNPVLYYAAYNVSDMNCQTIRTEPTYKGNPTFRLSIFQCLALGYTMVLNKKAKQLIYEQRSKKTVSKDVWIGMICAGLGEVYYDNRPCAQWRRNDGSFSGKSTSFLAIQKDRFKKFFKNDGLKSVSLLIDEFYDTFSDELSNAYKKELKILKYQGLNPCKILHKVFYPHKLRYNRKDDFMLRIMFLFKRI